MINKYLLVNEGNISKDKFLNIPKDKLEIAGNPPLCPLVGDTGFEPVTSTV